MPYKRKKDKAAQMRRYRKHKKQQMSQLEKAVRQGNLNLAKQILDTKPSIDLVGRKPKRKRKKR